MRWCSSLVMEGKSLGSALPYGFGALEAEAEFCCFARGLTKLFSNCIDFFRRLACGTRDDGKRQMSQKDTVCGLFE
jgi:hypothetical protein